MNEWIIKRGNVAEENYLLEKRRKLKNRKQEKIQKNVVADDTPLRGESKKEELNGKKRYEKWNLNVWEETPASSLTVGNGRIKLKDKVRTGRHCTATDLDRMTSFLSRVHATRYVSRSVRWSVTLNFFWVYGWFLHYCSRAKKLGWPFFWPWRQ